MTRRHADGLLELDLATDRSGRTYVRRRRHRFPLRTTVPLYLDPGDPELAYVYVQNPTGGVFAGDRLVTDVTAQPGTKVHLTTQSATKVYRMDGGAAVQQVSVRLGEGAYLEYLPDQLVPQAGSALDQHTRVDVGEGATFLGTETLTPGRAARNETFEYDRLTLRTEVWRGDETLCVDAVEFSPRRLDPRQPGVLDAGDYLASVLVVTPQRDTGELTARIDAALAADPTVVAAAGSLPNAAGTYARLVGRRGQDVRAALARTVSLAREATLGHPLPEVRK